MTQETIIYAILGAMVCIYLVKTIFLLGLAWIQAGFNLKTQADLSKSLLHSYLSRPWLLYKQNNSASYMQNINNEVQILMQSGFGAALEIITHAMLLIMAVFLMFLVEPLGTLVMIIIIGMAFAGFQHLSRIRVSHWGQIRKEHEALRLQRLQQTLNSAKEIKLWNCTEFFTEKFHRHSINLIYAGRWQSTLRRFPRLVFELLAVIGLSIAIIIMILSGTALDHIAPVIALFAAIFMKLMPSANSILTGLHSIRFIQETIDTVSEELSTSYDVAKGSNLKDNALAKADIALDQLTFSYPEKSSPALQDINLDIPHGTSVGIIGTSGAGKSTLIDTILGLLKPDDGLVSVNGTNIVDNLKNWQTHIGYVPQSIYLLDDTLRRNIAFGLDDTDIEEDTVLRAAKHAQLDTLIKNFPEGLDTIIGEDGGRLSGGEKQRIALARALYREPSVLILDEATSALDTQTEKNVMQAVQNLKGARSIIIITHRLSTIQDCDMVVKIENGNIVSVE